MTQERFVARKRAPDEVPLSEREVLSDVRTGTASQALTRLPGGTWMAAGVGLFVVSGVMSQLEVKDVPACK